MAVQCGRLIPQNSEYFETCRNYVEEPTGEARGYAVIVEVPALWVSPNRNSATWQAVLDLYCHRCTGGPRTGSRWLGVALKTPALL